MWSTTAMRATSLLLLWTVCPPVEAETSTLGEVKAKGGVPLTAQQLRDLLPGALVVSRTQAGSTRSWHNRADGSLIATSDGRGQSGGPPAYVTVEGTWRISEDARLCVAIPWPAAPENWCRYVFRAENTYYGVGTLSNESTASELEVSR